MAGAVLGPAPSLPGQARPIACYLADLQTRLRGDGRWRRNVLAEAEDGLLCAAEAHPAYGENPALAEALAVAAWGPVERIAAEYNDGADRLTARRLHRHGLLLTPTLALGWGLTLFVGPPAPWPHAPLTVLVCVVLLTGGAALAVGGGATGVLAGRGVRALTRARPGGFHSAIAAGHGLLLIIATTLVLLANRGVPHPHSLCWPAALAPLTASLTAILRLTALMRGLRPRLAGERAQGRSRRGAGKWPASAPTQAQHRESRYEACPSRSLSRERPEA